MITWLQLLILGLATFRLSLMFSKESGPMRMFQKLRKAPPPKSSAREGLSCPWCMSVYSSAFVLALHRYGGTVGELVTLWLAVSAVAIVVNQQWTKG